MMVLPMNHGCISLYRVTSVQYFPLNRLDDLVPVRSFGPRGTVLMRWVCQQAVSKASGSDLGSARVALWLCCCIIIICP